MKPRVFFQPHHGLGKPWSVDVGGETEMEKLFGIIETSICIITVTALYALIMLMDVISKRKELRLVY